jgi:uncharacterized membrane protein
MSDNISVYAIFKTRSDAEDALQQLRLNGFRPEDISILFPDNVGTKDMGVKNSTKAPEAAVAGGAAGAAAGGVFGWLVGAGSLAIPGVGPLIAAGPIMAALAGLGAGAALGGASGALVGAGIPEYEAQRYEGRVRDGGILVSVHCDNSDWTKRAKEILKHAGGEDVSSSKEAKADFAKSDKPRPRAASA